LRSALDDANRRGLPELQPLLEGLAQALAALRAADDEHAAERRQPPNHDAGQEP
jgi:hypothetical protein